MPAPGENGDTPTGFEYLNLQPHIGPTGFTAGIWTVIGISVLTIIARLILRIQRTKHLDIDDYILIAALLLLIAGAAVVEYYRGLIYMVLEVELGHLMPDNSFDKASPQLAKILTVSSVLLWSAIFSVKFSFLFFFRKLISRVRALQIYWWVVVGFVAPASQVCMWLGFIECTHFGADFFTFCPADKLIAREHIYLNVSVVLDIFTDLLIISLPIALLWNVKIAIAKKATLMSIFGLSVVMIVIAIIRVAAATIPHTTIIDTAWLFFWQVLEASIALIMVSVSAFRGLFGQTGRHSAYASGKHRRGNSAGMNAANCAMAGEVEPGSKASIGRIAATVPGKTIDSESSEECTTHEPEGAGAEALPKHNGIQSVISRARSQRDMAIRKTTNISTSSMHASEDERQQQQRRQTTNTIRDAPIELNYVPSGASARQSQISTTVAAAAAAAPGAGSNSTTTTPSRSRSRSRTASPAVPSPLAGRRTPALEPGMSRSSARAWSDNRMKKGDDERSRSRSRSRNGKRTLAQQHDRRRNDSEATMAAGGGAMDAREMV